MFVAASIFKGKIFVIPMNQHAKPTHLTTQGPVQPESSGCPNCGFAASGNFCANCGQQTHLHKDTFWGLISHFTAHYFHYDSKFWQTLKALVFVPGKLTVAYQQKKRQRYIPPISLYIFVSVVFFLLFSIFQKSVIRVNENPKPIQNTTQKVDSAPVSEKEQAGVSTSAHSEEQATSFANRQSERLFSELKNNPKEFKERFLHSFPKIFFFMIPVLAALLQLFLIRQKQFYFVDHAVFALHIHCFVFIIGLLSLLNPFEQIQNLLTNFIMVTTLVYLVVAVHRVYKSGWIKSFFIGIGTAALYALFLGAAVILDLWVLFNLKH